jgi:hypothetical protein
VSVNFTASLHGKSMNCRHGLDCGQKTKADTLTSEEKSILSILNDCFFIESSVMT